MATLTEMIDSLNLSEATLTALRTAEGTTFQAAANEFLSALVNKICYQVLETAKFSNQFADLKKFDIEYGATLENVFVEIPEGYDYNKDNTDPFDTPTPTVQTLYVSINKERQYRARVNKDLIKRAVLSISGMTSLVDLIVTSLGKAADIEDYAATLTMLNNTDCFAGGQVETVDLSALATDAEKYKQITATIVDTATSFTQPIASNNNLGVLNPTAEGDVLLIIRREIYNHINLDYLAGVYNLAKVDLVKRIKVVETFQYDSDDNDIDLIVCDASGFDLHTALNDNGQIYNPANRTFNIFQDRWGVFGFKRWANCKAFKFTLTSN